MAYGVIGNTTVSGTVILGSSPGRPATELWFCVLMPRSSSGLGRRPLTAVTRVQIPYGVQVTASALHWLFRFVPQIRTSVEAEASSARNNPLSSTFTGEPSRSGSSALDAASVLLAALSLSSAVPLLAIPAAVLVALGGGELGSSMCQLYPGSSAGSSRGDESATFPERDVLPAELRSMRHIERDLWELTVWSPSMQREVVIDVLLPSGAAPRPTFYLMMGADGAAGSYSWANSSDYQAFFAGKHVNVITPKGSVSSMQADWYREDPATGTNKWLTYMTRELPPLIDAHFRGNGHDAIAGISMPGGPALDIAANAPDRFVAAASYSGCPATTGVLGGIYTSSGVTMNKGNPFNMWGTSSNRACPAPHGDRSSVYACSKYFAETAQQQGLDVTWHEIVEGAHTWGVFEYMLLALWPTMEGASRESGAWPADLESL